jgi:cysteine rich repeat protein
MATHIHIAALFFLLLPVAASAQTPAAAASPQVTEGRGKVRVACAADVQKLCPSIERGKGQMQACLQAHESELSEACRAARAERAAAKSKSKD